MTARYWDVRYVIPFVFQVWMFCTPVIYPLSAIPERFRWIIALNPLTGIVGGFRAALLGDKPDLMQQKYPALLASYRPMVQKADLGAKGVWYRLRIGPIPDKTAAAKLCSQLKAQGLPDCLVASQ